MLMMESYYSFNMISQIPQLYVSPPASAASPPYLLKGFDSIYLAPGQQQTVTLNLSRYDLSIWDVASQTWTVPRGNTHWCFQQRPPFDWHHCALKSFICDLNCFLRCFWIYFIWTLVLYFVRRYLVSFHTAGTNVIAL